MLVIALTSAPSPAYAGVGCADGLKEYRNAEPPFDVLVLTTATKVDLRGTSSNDPGGASIGDALRGNAVCAGCNDPCPEPT